MDTEKKQNTFLKTTFVVTLIIILSKVAGFARDIFFSATFGMSMASDAYNMAYTMLNTVSLVFLMGISATFIPIYTKARMKFGEDQAHLYASNILNLYMVLGLLVGILGFLFAPEITKFLWYGDAQTGELIVTLSQILYPSLMFYAVSGVLVNILNARKKFIPEQLIGFALSFCVILACVVFKDIVAVTISTALSAILQVIILIPFLRKNFKYKKSLNLKNKELRRTFKLAVPSLISIAFDDINSLTNRMFASNMGLGVVSSLRYSYTLVQTALGILIVPITTIMFSELSGLAAAKKMDEIKSAVCKSLEVVALITLPIIVIAVVCSKEVIGLVYQRGNFTLENTLFTAPVFALYIVGIFAFGIRNFLTRVFYALQLTKIPMIIGIVTVSINILLNYLLKDVLGAKGLTLATSLSGFLGAILMLITLRKKLGDIGLKKSLGQFAKIFLCTAISAVIIILLHNWLLSIFTAQVFSSYLTIFIICTVAGLGIYMLFAFLLKINMASSLGAMVKSKFRRNK